MIKERDFKFSVGTADEYEDYIAEIRFPGKSGFIVSQESGPGNFEISLHSFIQNQEEDFDYCRNIDAAKISLESLQEAIGLAVSELKRLKKDA